MSLKLNIFIHIKKLIVESFGNTDKDEGRNAFIFILKTHIQIELLLTF